MVLWFFKGPQFFLKEPLLVRYGNCREGTGMTQARVIFLSQLPRINTSLPLLHGNGPHAPRPLGIHLGPSVPFSTVPLPEKQCPPYFQEPGPWMAKASETPPFENLLPSPPQPPFSKSTSFLPTATTTRSKYDARKSLCFLHFLLRAFNN